MQIFWKFPTSTIYVSFSFHNLSVGKTQNLYLDLLTSSLSGVREGEISGMEFIINIYNFSVDKIERNSLKMWRILYEENWYDFIFHQNKLLKGSPSNLDGLKSAESIELMNITRDQRNFQPLHFVDSWLS